MSRTRTTTARRQCRHGARSPRSSLAEPRPEAGPPAGTGCAPPAPSGLPGWSRRVQEVAALIEATAPGPGGARDLGDAVGLLRRAGLVTLLGPVAQGAAGLGWGTALRAVRRIAEADGSVGRALGEHYVWSGLPAFQGTAGQAEEILANSTRAGWFFGAAIDLREGGLVAFDTGLDLEFSGWSASSTGAAAGDVIWLGATVAGHADPVLALVPARHHGLTFDETAVQARPGGAGEGGVTVDRVVLPWSAALGRVEKEQRPRPYRPLTPLALELVEVNLHLGAARAVLRGTSAAGGPRTDDGLLALLDHVTTLADRAGDLLEDLVLIPGAVTPGDREDLVARVAEAARGAAGLGPEVTASTRAGPAGSCPHATSFGPTQG
ncbi:hypothetical protein J4G33_07180 [Actinotalea sp. BY-33]|uniref:Acyl-CoA dehydrogenase n=1 Tax=Actinotalea soli TaxID=2819234 RepID=A0A939RVW9_9CELL|nr:hypothetical protein [Actinotalea soli]MBO1751586.1 hypothetical protein [Actinotalea soli]